MTEEVGRTEGEVFRWLPTTLPTAGERRLVVIAGARQTGKTTLARSTYRDLRYCNLDDLELRTALRDTRTTSWARSVGAAVLDEAQKEPRIFDKVKFAFDAGELDFSVLLGSSRILLLEKIRETLAGRAFLYNLWPLMLSELAAGPQKEAPPRPLLDALLNSSGSIGEVLDGYPEILLGKEEDRRRAALEMLELWGGMPALLPLEDSVRREWLRSYQQTFLERDLSDLVRLRDLEPFRTLQQLVMLRSGQLLSYSKLGRDANVSATTAQRYLEYLDLSFQVVKLRPYYRNLTSSLVKSPKIFWVDLGLLRQGLQRWGSLDGAQFEALVVTEIHKWVDTMRADARLYFYRTRSGREVDLLIETPAGLIGIEIKRRSQVSPRDASTLVHLAKALAERSEGPRWLGGLVVFQGSHLRPLVEEHDIWQAPVHHLLA